MFTFDLFSTCSGWKSAMIGVPEDSWAMPELMKDGGYIKPVIVWRAYKKRPPPPIWGATSAFYPHNFSHQKSRKKSPWQDWKKFRKKFAGKCFGVRESPQSCRKGARGAKIWKDCMGKDSGIIRYCKRIVLSFCFRTIEPCWCLVGRCLCVLLSFGTWMRLVCRKR